MTATLADHRIARIDSHVLRDHYPRTVGRNARLGSHGAGGSVPVAVVHTDTGATGWGIAAGDLQGTQGLVGRRVDDLLDPAVGTIEPQALPLDFALHDLAGQILGLPVHQLLGGRGETVVPCYDGAIYFDDLDPADAPRGLDAVLANCRADHDLGFRAFKLKIGRGHRWMDADAGLRRDIEVTRAVRAAYPEAEILVDANDGYTGESFLGYLDEVADCGLFWVEEPFQETRADLRRLRAELTRRGSGTLIADGEAAPDVPFLLHLSEEGLLDVLLMDVMSYGISRWRRVMPVLEEVGVRASPHAWGQPLKTLYAAQLAAGLGNVLVVEGVPGHTEGVDGSAYQLLDGMLHVPDAPGFGLPLPATTAPSG
ncbi:enolase C-terminal domain-like protein [Actinopolymorpha alba]|uniref:enolase C-terminal domain-like protein n=1 Tax=Actinopolymorpha alba TaxID=533267 RepID=UPI000374F96F|nr:enolase C-terminal domain-like protein [Actinopolymorpha alba]